MNHHRSMGRTLRLVPVLVALAVLVALPGRPSRGDDDRGGAAGDPARVVGPGECRECHEAVYAAWEASPHFGTEELLGSDEAEQIAERFDPDLLPDDEGSPCRGCHITVDHEDDTAGVSCESCHGAARDYLDQHSLVQKGGVKVKPHEEDLAAAAARVERAVSGFGMIPSTRHDRRSFVRIADNCFGCHTVPDERLVNVGGHPAGSAFDLVAWSQGVVRHNFHRSASDKARSASEPDRQNVAASAADLRLFHVVGKGLDLEFGLRGLSEATEAGDYATAMSARVEAARSALEAIQAAAPTTEVGQAIAAASGAGLRPGNRADLAGRADRVRAAMVAFVAAHDGSGLGGLDALVPRSLEGTPYQR